ncbi:hypothetical protein Tco_0580550 [Tanacetum coccineum]
MYTGTISSSRNTIVDQVHTLENVVPAPVAVWQPPRKDPQMGYSMIVPQIKQSIVTTAATATYYYMVKETKHGSRDGLLGLRDGLLGLRDGLMSQKTSSPEQGEDNQWHNFRTDDIKEVQGSLLHLKNTMYHSRQILRIPRLRQIQDHCLTLKNTPYRHLQIRRI